MHKGLAFLANNAIGMLALFIALGGTTYAAAGGFSSSSGTLQACASSSGTLTLLKSGKHCKKGQRTLAWNQQGPAGAKGASGAPGAPGAAGAEGAKGVAGVPTNMMWADVEEDGTIQAGDGVDGAEITAFADYRVSFDRDVSKCAVVASENSDHLDRTVFDVLKLNDAPSNEVQVITTNHEFKEERTPFSIIAVC